MKYTIKDGRNKVWQWDIDVALTLDGVADGTEIHLGYSATTALKKVVENGEILIPNVLLTRNRDIPLFVYHDDATHDSALLPVEGRPKPPDYVYTEPERLTWEQFEIRIEALEKRNWHDHGNKDVLDGITADRVTAWDNAEQNSKDHADKGLSALEKKIPTKTSQITNDNGFITNAVANLLNYYQKSETYTKDEVKALVSAIPKFSIQVVSALPTSDISTTTIYLMKTGDDGGDLYQEYIYVNGAWENLGSQKVDLSGYLKEEDLPEPLLVTFTEAADGTITRDKTMGDIVVAHDHVEVTGILNTPTDKARLRLAELEAVFEEGSDTGYYVAHFEGFYDSNNTRVLLKVTNQENVKAEIAQEVPTELPNPFQLTINGTSYDGSEAVEVEISGGSGIHIGPEAPTDENIDVWIDTDEEPDGVGSGGSGCSGGINITGAEVGQTIKIAAVDENGVPTAWEAASLTEWRLIKTITVEEDTAEIAAFTVDDDGNQFDLSGVRVTCSNIASGVYVSNDMAGRVWVGTRGAAKRNDTVFATNDYIEITMTQNPSNYPFFAQILNCGGIWRVETSNGRSTLRNNSCQIANSGVIQQISLGTNNLSNFTYAAGTIIEVWGLDA